jgi:uncharacterized protein (DUF433 family)
MRRWWSARALESIFGTVTVTRLAYLAPGALHLHPGDAALNLPPERYSHEVQRQAALEIPRSSYDASGQTLARTTAAHVPKRQLQALARRAASDFDALGRYDGIKGREKKRVMVDQASEKSLLERITTDPEICHGKPCLRGLRYPVEWMLELLSSGMTYEEILSDYPDLEREDILSTLLYASKLSQVKQIYRSA